MDYKSVFTNLCLELQQNRSWIKGLGKNPQKSELIHWWQCLFSGGTEACSLGLRETPACIHVIQRLSQPRVACWHGFRQNSQKTECVFTRCPTGGRKKIACIHGLRSEGVNETKSGQPNKCLFSLTFRELNGYFFYYGRISSAQLDRWQALMQWPIINQRTGRTDGIPERDQRQWI